MFEAITGVPAAKASVRIIPEEPSRPRSRRAFGAGARVRRSRGVSGCEEHDCYQLTSFQISGRRVASSAPTSEKIATARLRCAIASSARPAAW